MEEVISFLISYVLFPGLIFAGVVGLFLEGIDRKVAAHAQHRIGPPVWQPFLDFGKLMGKEDITPATAQSWIFTLAPLLALGAAVTAMTMIPVNAAQPAFVSAADVIVLIYLLNIPAIAIILGGYASGSPFGTIGSSRYMVLILSYEFAFIVAVLTAAAQAETLSLAGIVAYQAQHGWFIFQLPLAAIAILLVLPGKLLRVPFDIPEAHTEIVHGPMTEYSGPKLAIFRLAYNIETLAVAGFIAALFLGGPMPFTVPIIGVTIPGIVMFLIKCLAIVLFLTIVRASVARLRIDQALKFYWAVVAVLALANLAWVVIF